MRGRALAAVGLAATLGLLVACGPAQQTQDVTDQGYQSGDGSTKTWPAGDRKGPVELAGTDFEGTSQDIADWRGDVVVVNTWYAACPPCRAEAPDLAALANDYADQGVHLIGVNGTDAAGAAQSFQERFEVPYPTIADQDGAAIAALQGVVPMQATPSTVVLDREGKVAATVIGLADPTTLRAIVDDVLAEPPATP
ncbi:TlpA family protein disulfide reductase [Cellulomonas composti]|uniref:TlpA family protein disulfide reductase n=1 Tax=Cellulomonas composti TaxID=266130 RepID=UPI0011BDEB3A